MGPQHGSRLRSTEEGSVALHLPGPLRRHPARAVLFLVPLAVLGMLAFSLGAYWLRSEPGAKSVAAAVRALPSTTTAGARGSVSTRLEPPATGVYSLTGSGSEHISFPPNSQRDGAVMPASVTSLGKGCWRWHLDYNVAHWEEYDFCAVGDTLVQTANRNGQSWDFGSFSITNTARFSCPGGAVVVPADPSPRAVLDWTCTGRSTTVPGEAVATTAGHLLGVRTLHVGGTAVQTLDEEQITTLAGAQRGTVDMGWWFSLVTGLPVRVTRSITIATSSPVGDITYTENGSWQMSSLAPRR